MVEPVFKNINAEDSDNGITEIESLCMQCHENVRSCLFYFVKAILQYLSPFFIVIVLKF